MLRRLLFFFFLISDHFIQKPCYIITLYSPGELHMAPLVYITHVRVQQYLMIDGKMVVVFSSLLWLLVELR